MPTYGRIAALCCLALALWSAAAGAQNLKIGVVDLDRLVRQSPQAAAAKRHMAAQFARRKQRLEHRSDVLSKAIDRLKHNAADMSEPARQKQRAAIRDRQRKLAMRQSEYNDDVSAAEQKELGQLRGKLRRVIDAYATDHGFDLILGDSVLYAAAKVDVTDAILARLKKQQ